MELKVHALTVHYPHCEHVNVLLYFRWGCGWFLKVTVILISISVRL